MWWRGLLFLTGLFGCASAEPTDAFAPPSYALIERRDCPGELVAPRYRPPSGELEAPPPPLPTRAGGVVEGPLVVAHAGVGTSPRLADGPRIATIRGLDRLELGASALEAAIASTVSMEDDPRFNAGTGSHIRLDGKTIQMDAAVLTSQGDFAAVAAIERVKNPVLVARAVLETPHSILVGDGATRFAHKIGFADMIPTSTASEARYRDRMKRLRRNKGGAGWKPIWNFEDLPPALLEHGDTVGTVARDGDGGFAATLSTGGTSYTLRGRIGDVAIFGAGAYAGPAGAIACTGDGETIIAELVARTAYARLEDGIPAALVVIEAVRKFPEGSSLGIIAIDRTGWGVAANRPMAFAVAHSTDEPIKGR